MHICDPAKAPRPITLAAESFRANHLSKTSCLTQVFSNVANKVVVLDAQKNTKQMRPH